MQLDSSIFDDFKTLTGMDISGYFANALSFFNGDYNTIVNYYSGASKTITSQPFANFTNLRKLNKTVFETFKEHSRQFNNLKWWLLLDQIEEIDNRLATLGNINKWSRSSITNVAYDPSFQVDYILPQNQSLEGVSSNVLGSSNPNDDWVDIALNNDLKEEDYDSDGGNDLKLSFNRSNNGFKINAVVDVIAGKSIYGKDVYRKIQWDTVNNDLTVLGYDDTILQGAKILSNLRKNDNPDNPFAGLQSNLVVGTNKAIFNFPIIIRQLTQTFSADDRFKNFTVSNIKIDQDNFSYDYSVQTRLNEVVQNGDFT